LPDAGVIENSLDYAGWDMGSFGLPGIFDPVPETAGVGEGANVMEPMSIVDGVAGGGLGRVGAIDRMLSNDVESSNALYGKVNDVWNSSNNKGYEDIPYPLGLKENHVFETTGWQDFVSFSFGSLRQRKPK